MFPSRAALLGGFVARQEARKATCVASPPSQSPIGVVKRNHTLYLTSRIKFPYFPPAQRARRCRASNLV